MKTPDGHQSFAVRKIKGAVLVDTLSGYQSRKYLDKDEKSENEQYSDLRKNSMVINNSELYYLINFQESNVVFLRM